MRKTLTSIVLLACLCMAAGGGEMFGQESAPMPFQMPAISRSGIAFVYAGSIWVVDRQGGRARRLTQQPGEEGTPVFSPDGSQIAFSKENGGNLDVFVVRVEGGEPVRLTWHPGPDFVAGWTPDGKRVLFASRRTGDGPTRLFTIASTGGFPEQLPLPMGWEGSFSPDGAQIAYTPWRDPAAVWRNYRGGQTLPVRIAKLSDSSIETIPRENSNDRAPMWIGETIYFLSDRTGTVNLFAYDLRTKKVAQKTRYEKHDIRAASAGAEAVVYVQGGALHEFDLRSGRDRVVPVTVEGEFPETKPRTIKAQRWVRSYNLSPDGSQVLLNSRGEILTLNAADQKARNLTATSGSAERFPSWSPDGKWIAYFSDESGEYQLHLRPANGEGEIRKIAIESNPSFYEEPVWSPDSRRVAFSDKRLSLWMVDLERKESRRIATSTYPGQGTLRPNWSPDGQWLAYAMYGANRLRAIYLHSLASGKSTRVTDARFDADFPAFDRSGKYLFVTLSSMAGPATGFGMTSLPFRGMASRTVHVAVLDRRAPSPLIPVAKDAAATGPVQIDVEGLSERILRLPIPARNYTRLEAGRAGHIFLFEESLANVFSDGLPERTVHRFDLATRKIERFIERSGGFTLSPDGSKILFQQSGNWAVAATDVPPKEGAGKLDLSSLEIQLDPRAEWRQMYDEAWRLLRDYLYDPNHHGQDLPRLKSIHAAYLPNIATRGDLNQLFRQMFSHISISHMQIGGGDVPGPSGPSSNVGLLGADYTIDEGRYRITRIYRGDNSHPQQSGPLAQPGIDVRVGDYLISIDGQDIRATANLYRQFAGKAGRPAQLTVAARADGSGSRTCTVVPMSNDAALRDFSEAEDNRRLVEKLSGGKLGYIYLPDTGRDGYMIFNRDFFAGFDKQGIIVDERYNSGGFPADYFIEVMKREPLSYYAFREGEDLPFPNGVLLGPRVMLINEFAGSGGDTLPWMFRQAKLGTLVGKRTWGGGIGGFVQMPDFVDGGRMLAPNRGFYNPWKGVWDIENQGVAPDVEVEILPGDWRAGRDPQLERAVQIALDALKRKPPSRPARPKYPLHQ